MRYGNLDFEAGDELGYFYLNTILTKFYSLDEIITAQKRKGQAAGNKSSAGGKGARNVFMNKRQQNKRASKFKRSSGGGGRVIRAVNKNVKSMAKPNQVHLLISLKVHPLFKKRVGMLKRQTFASVKNARIQKNRNMVLATKNLVRKLVKVCFRT